MIRILLVDDQKTVRESLKAVLNSMSDVQVVGTASDGYTALEQVEILEPDLILMDVEMPNLDGISATKIICNRFPGVKVIMLSMHDSDSYVFQAMYQGAKGYLFKNTPAKELEAAVRFVYGGSAQIEPKVLNKILSQIPEFNLNLLTTNNSKLQKQKPTEINAIRSPLKTINLPNLEKKSSLRRFRRSWKFYIAIWVIGNSLLWTTVLTYLKFAKPVYTSSWTINLPASRSSMNVDLPGIGSAASQTDSPYSTHTSDPREIYKFLATTEEVLQAAASQLDMTVKEFGKPKIQLVDNSTLMSFKVEGNEAQAAYKKALLLNNALNQKLNQLRQEEIVQLNEPLQTALSSSEKKLQEAQKRLSEFKAGASISSGEQMQNLSVNIEDLRRQRAETIAQLKQVDANLQELSANLNVSVSEVGDAFIIQSDSLFQQYLGDYTRINAELVNLESKFLSTTPQVIAKRAEKNKALTALSQRGQVLLKKPFSEAILEQLGLNTNVSSNSNRANLFQELISFQTQQKGLQVQAQELEQQIKNLESRRGGLSQQESTLANLQRNVQIAEALFSSTLTKLDLSKSNTSNAHPSFQVIEQPNIPKKTSSPNSKLVLLGTSIGSFFLTTGLSLLWWRDRRNQPRKVQKQEIELKYTAQLKPYQ